MSLCLSIELQAFFLPNPTHCSGWSGGAAFQWIRSRTVDPVLWQKKRRMFENPIRYPRGPLHFPYIEPWYGFVYPLNTLRNLFIVSAWIRSRTVDTVLRQKKTTNVWASLTLGRRLARSRNRYLKSSTGYEFSEYALGWPLSLFAEKLHRTLEHEAEMLRFNEFEVEP